jgi:hypothetical protein
MESEYSEEKPDHGNSPFDYARAHGKRNYVSFKKSCYLIPIHYDPEL